MQHLPSACMLSHRFCISSDVEFLKVSEESSTEGGHLLWWRTDWLKTQHCRDSITIGKSWHSGQHCKADMGKENYDKKIMQDDSNFSHFWLSQRLWSSLDRTCLKNTADMHLWKKYQHITYQLHSNFLKTCMISAQRRGTEILAHFKDHFHNSFLRLWN